MHTNCTNHTSTILNKRLQHSHSDCSITVDHTEWSIQHWCVTVVAIAAVLPNRPSSSSTTTAAIAVIAESSSAHCECVQHRFRDRVYNRLDMGTLMTGERPGRCRTGSCGFLSNTVDPSEQDNCEYGDSLHHTTCTDYLPAIEVCQSSCPWNSMPSRTSRHKFCWRLLEPTVCGTSARS